MSFYHPVMRIAHLIMAHKAPLQLSRLIDRMNHSQFDFYVHVDLKTPIEGFEFLLEKKNVYLIDSRSLCNWGGWSFTRAILNSMGEILSKDIDYGFINLLSGQDYPLKPAGVIYNYFKQRPGQNFIYYDASEKSYWWKEASSRYEKYHFTDLTIKKKYLFQLLLNVFSPKRKFPLNLHLYGGSNASWWTISSDCARYVLQAINTNEHLQNFLKYCWGTDEFVITTLIMNSEFKEQTINNNFRYIDWSEGKAHPKFLGKEDFDQLKENVLFFARKFDQEKDPEILDQIDQHCLKMNSKDPAAGHPDPL
ncbi:core-2/I-Branching enzyme [Pedobacter nutrimenti]|uniref:Peptide O-xylosyltransferase n=2 Tax=Pedobacter nutrimenti TaxID=1241337 RepID=A0A318U9V1_9SPHI|nr:core-2/I-Branching enzyme [Pedobacter nutrimenti]